MSNNFLAIDGPSIKQKLMENLNNSSVFTDQNYIGSNIAILNDHFSYAFSLLFYNLSQNIHAGMFSETEVLENMNRILKMFSYKPLGYQTCSVPTTITINSSVSPGIYVIPRFSYVTIGGIKFTLMEDYSFTKNTQNEEIIGENIILHQGDIGEYNVKPQGIPNERFNMVLNNGMNLDHYNFRVFVKRNNNWILFKPTPSLFLHNGDEYVFEYRLNENNIYEFSFGNNINGVQLDSNDTIVVFYLKTDGTKGEIKTNTLNRRIMARYKSPRFNEIYESTQPLSGSTLENGILVTNPCPSSPFGTKETVDEMRKNAPSFFKTQFRVVTIEDYEIFIKTNFSDLIQDIKVFNNSSYMDSYMKYHWNMGLTKQDWESRALFNQVKFADSCNFNNIYAFIVPKGYSELSYVPETQKSLIINTVEPVKSALSELIISDPVFVYFDLVINGTTEEIPEDEQYTVIKITKSRNTRKSNDEIINQVYQVFENYFKKTNCSLGQIVDISRITSDILSMDEVIAIKTENIITGNSKDGIVLLSWNPFFEEQSKRQVSSNVKLEDFQFPYFKGLSNLKNRIIIE